MNSDHLVIYVEQISERLNYTFDFVFKERGVRFSVTNDFSSFAKVTSPRLNYSNKAIEDVLQLPPSEVLFDEEFIAYELSVDSFCEVQCLSFNGILDPFASVFYHLTRYEEYFSFIQDQHGRFTSKLSFAIKHNWLEKAMCDRWSQALVDWIAKNTSVVSNKPATAFRVIPGFDIDNAYAYQYKEGLRSILTTIKDRVQRKTAVLTERKKVLSGESIDPYDTYDYIQSLEERGVAFYMFWLVGDFARFDRNVSHLDPRHQRLIRKMDLCAEIGVHPSYKSTKLPHLIDDEKKRLERILDHPINHARQHFLKIEFPQTYRNYLSSGIAHDHSMGYADHIGFRAGTARPFKWFDLINNQTTELWIHPFVYMDGTLNEYMKLSPEAAKQKIVALADEIKQMGGNFECIWHNETLSDNRHWTGWREVLEFTLDQMEQA